MKPAPKRPQGLQLIAICFLGIGIVTFLFLQTQASNEKEHTQIQDRLRQIKQIDANLDEAVLSLRFRVVGSCDAVVEKVAQLLSTQAELEGAVKRGYPQRPGDVVACLRGYKNLISQKQALIENFKSTHAILNNSLNCYPLADTRLKNELNAKQGYALLVSELAGLGHNILLYNLTEDEGLKSQTETEIANLCRAYRFCPPHSQDDFAILLKHAHSILRRKGEVDALLAAIITLPTGDANDRLYAVEQFHNQEMRRYASRCRYGIYFACLMLICYVAHILMNLNKQKQALGVANDHLEYHVAQRTQALHESQERYEVAVSGSNEGIWDWDLLTSNTYFSLRYKELLGFTEDEFQNCLASFSERLHPDDADHLNAAIQAHLSGEAPYLVNDFRLRVKSGEYRWFHGRGQALRDKQGRAYRVAGSITDITDRKVLESQLAHAQKMESIGQLAAGIAHEINTPIQYIGDNVRFLQEGFLALQTLLTTYLNLVAATADTTESAALAADAKAAAEQADLDYLLEEIPRAITQSLEGADRVSKIVRAMKVFSHPGTLEKTPTDINSALESTLMVARNEWKYAAELVTEFDADLPLVPCLPGDVNQVFLNLIVNAAHAITDVVQDSGEKGVITVRTWQEADEIEIRIQDTGTGIPVAVRSRIFDPFFTTKEVGKGTGQGLAIAHSIIVKKHGGTIGFETEMGKGTTFIVRLPLLTQENIQQKAA